MRRLLACVVLGLVLCAGAAQAAFQNGNLICETTTTAGTGTVDLGGACDGGDWVTFVTQIASGSTLTYTIVAPDGTLETGIGTYTDAATDTLARTTVLRSSGGGTTKLTLSGTSRVYLQWNTASFNGGVNSFDVADLTVDTEVYVRANWNADETVPTKDAISDELEKDHGDVNVTGSTWVVEAGDSATGFWPSGVCEVARGCTGQATEAEAIGEMTQALTVQDALEMAEDYISLYDADDDTGKKVRLDSLAGNLRVGEFFWHTASATCPSYSLPANGTNTLSRTTYARLWAAVSAIASGAPDAADWGTGNGTTTFQIPDLTTADRFIRAGTFGTAQDDAAPNIIGQSARLAMEESTSPSGAMSRTVGFANFGLPAADSAWTVYYLNFNADDSDATYGAASEVRPTNVSWTPCIVF